MANPTVEASLRLPIGRIMNVPASRDVGNGPEPLVGGQRNLRALQRTFRMSAVGQLPPLATRSRSA